ncbi:MAG: glycosyltransferase [Planctomycetaceae bacterium]
MNESKICVGMPVYNGEKYVGGAIESLLFQTYPHFRLLISDNASTDATEKICREYASHDSRIIYVRRERNCGAFENFRLVLNDAKSPFFTWLAHDDVLDPAYLATMLGTIEADDRIVLAASDFKIMDADGGIIKVEELDAIRPTIQWHHRRVEFFQNPISNVYLCIYGVMRTESLRKVFSALSAPAQSSGGELPILSRIACEGQIVAIPDAVRSYRRHAYSEYAREQQAASSYSINERRWQQFKHNNCLRVDQCRALLGSKLSLVDKFRIMAYLIKIYGIKIPRSIRRLVLQSNC